MRTNSMRWAVADEEMRRMYEQHMTPRPVLPPVQADADVIVTIERPRGTQHYYLSADTEMALHAALGALVAKVSQEGGGYTMHVGELRIRAPLLQPLPEPPEQ